MHCKITSPKLNNLEKVFPLDCHGDIRGRTTHGGAISLLTVVFFPPLRGWEVLFVCDFNSKFKAVSIFFPYSTCLSSKDATSKKY